MIEDILKAIRDENQVRQNLSQLKTVVRELNLTDTDFAPKDIEMFLELLKQEDAKVRKNTALLLGELQVQDALEALWEAYEKESQLFVLSSYLNAMGKLDCRSILQLLQKRYMQMLQVEIAEEEKKHRNEEMHVLAEILLSYNTEQRHKFIGLDQSYPMILTVKSAFGEITKAQLNSIPSKLCPLGVQLKAKDLSFTETVRTYRDLLFELNLKHKNLQEPKELAREIVQSGLIDFLYAVHDKKGSFAFRVDLKSKMKLDKKTIFAKKVAASLEELSGHKLINSTSNYEIELRILETKDNMFYPLLKLNTIQDQRFWYRKNSVATSMHPTKAAAMVAVGKQYMRERAQVLDPFCGVGTLLIERALQVPSGDMYGIDIYREAIDKARENTQLANFEVNYINRDYFDFTHEYLFDEIITEMPLRGRKTKEEMDDFYALFFKKSKTLLKKNGIMILYSNEMSFIKKQIRIQEEFQLKKELCVQKKDGSYIYIIGYKG